MEEIAIWLLLGSFIVFMLARMPIVFALGTSSLLTALYLDLPLAILAQTMVKGIWNFSFLAIPFCVLAGEIMCEGTIIRKLVTLSNSFIGHVRGGIAIVDVTGCMLFGGMSGSSVADASCVGSVSIPMMKERGYDADYAAVVTAFASTQGILIPPSHNAVMYAIIAGISISDMLIAGIIPGIMVAIGTAILAYGIAMRRNYVVIPKVSWHERFMAMKKAILPLFTIVIVFGGIGLGMYTVTESNAIIAIYAFCLSLLVYRELSLRSITTILYRSVCTLSNVIILISFSAPFGWLLAYLKVPSIVTHGILSFSNNEYIVMLLINFILLVLGFMIDTTPTLIICTPIMLPIVMQFGVDPIQFGMMMMMTMCIALVHPPLGISLYVSCAIAKVPVENVIRTSIPFYVMMIVILLLIIFIPSVTLLLPNLMN